MTIFFDLVDFICSPVSYGFLKFAFISELNCYPSVMKRTSTPAKSFPTRSKSHLTFTEFIEYVRYLYRILIYENMFKCTAFFVSILILKFGFNSI